MSIDRAAVGESERLSGGADRLWLLSGALAGVLAAIFFAWIHDLLITDIWDMMGVMGTAGAISGTLLAWTYRRMAEQPSITGWVLYNLAYVALFAVLPALSFALFEPVMTFAEASASEGPLDELIVEALPMTIGAVLVIAGAISGLFGSLRRDFGPVLLTVVLLMAFLGLNLTIIGLVEFSGTPFRVIAGFVGLIFGIGAVFALAFVGLQWSTLRSAVPRHQVAAKT